MEYYAVKKLAKLAGVSVRTLHLYDKMGLLTPFTRTEARYRLYGEKELLRLQQILFYRELDIPLKEIGDILDDPTFDLTQALETHRTALLAKQERISTLIDTIDKTLYHLKNKTMLKVEELYEGLSPETVTGYREKAISNWGEERVLKGEDILRNLSKNEVDDMREELDAVTKQLLASKDKDPGSREVQALIARHYKVIMKFTGRSEEHGTADYGKCLGELYLSFADGGDGNTVFSKFAKRAIGYFVG